MTDRFTLCNSAIAAGDRVLRRQVGNLIADVGFVKDAAGADA